MIHECLLNLWRCPLPLNSETNWINFFQINEFLHPGEQKLLQIIVDIASDYHKIDGFVRFVLNQNVEIGHLDYKISKGLYIMAFCNGVHTVLKDYRKELIKLEALFLENPELSLTFILSSFKRFQYLFKTLLSVIQVIQEENVHGCLLIGRLHKYGYCEVDHITVASKLITKSISQIFHRHLCNWIYFGDLIDTYEEFFILDEKVPDENFLYPEQLLKESENEITKTGLQLRRSKIRKPPFVQKFSINWKMVPGFIDEDTAENILFMGRIVWIMRNEPKNSSKDNFHNKCEITNQGKDNEYYETLQDLETHIFNNIELGKIMEKCRNRLRKYLWSKMLNEGNLIEHLNLIREYFALGRGELFQQFITVSETHLKDTSSTTIQGFNFIFFETARKMYGPNDKTYLQFELTSSSDITHSNPWTKFQLNFEINWPLHIVFHPKIMSLYNKLFCFLLRLKKTQVDLNKSWASHVFKKQAVDRRLWTLRQNLLFLVNNLQYYLQVDVIEAQFSLFLKVVENTNEVEDIIKVHQDFISDLLAKTFVATCDGENYYNNKHQLYQMPSLQFETPSKVYNIIIKLLDLCEEFCMITSDWDAKLTEPQIEELKVFKKRSESIIETLLFILNRLHEKVTGHYLLQLLLQLDFNHFYSKNKPDFNLTVFI